MYECKLDTTRIDMLLYPSFYHSIRVRGIALAHPRALVRRARVISLKQGPTW